MSFRDMVRADNQRVFTNLLEFARPTTIVFDGDRWDDVPCVLTQVRAKDRQAGQSDHAQGIYLVSANAYFDVTQTGGAIPEKGSRIAISDETGFLRQYYVAAASCPEGMAHLELEGLDE